MRSIQGRSAGTAGVAVFVLIALGACVSAPAFRAATPEESSRLLAAWILYRDAALSRGPMEMFYDAQVSRSVVTMSGTLAARDDPGKTLALRVQGPLGLPVARADWNGKETKVFVAGSSKGEQTLSSGADLSKELGVPVTPMQLSLLLFGLPDAGPPEATEVVGGRARFSWQGGALRCEFDPSSSRVAGVESRGSRSSVEIRFLDWSAGLPSRIRIKTSTGAAAELTLRSAERSAG